MRRFGLPRFSIEQRVRQRVAETYCLNGDNHVFFGAMLPMPTGLAATEDAGRILAEKFSGAVQCSGCGNWFLPKDDK